MQRGQLQQQRTWVVSSQKDPALLGGSHNVKSAAEEFEVHRHSLNHS